MRAASADAKSPGRRRFSHPDMAGRGARRRDEREMPHDGNIPPRPFEKVVGPAFDAGRLIDIQEVRAATPSEADTVSPDRAYSTNSAARLPIRAPASLTMHG